MSKHRQCGFVGEAEKIQSDIFRELSKETRIV
jgi:hypothetical protein